MTATILEERVDTDDDLVVESEEQHEEPCVTVGCPQPAVFRGLMTCCGATFVICADCLIEAKEWASSMAMLMGQVSCTMCDELIMGPEQIRVLGRVRT